MIRPFEFAFPQTRIVHGAGCVARVADVLRELDRKRCIVVAGPNVSRNDFIVSRIRSGLGGAYAGWFSDIDANLPLASAVEGVRLVERERADSVLAVGGGAAIGAAKTIAALVGQTDDIEVFLRRYRTRHGHDGLESPTPPAPKVVTLAVHTTLSGSEITSTAKVVLPDGSWANLRAFGLGPRATFCDPEIAATTPPTIMLGTAMNALDHNVESFYGKFKHAIRDAFSLAALRLLCPHILRYAEHPDDLDAVGGLLLGSVLSNASLDSLLILERGVHGFNHAIGHVLRADYGMLQGDAHAIVMPHGMEFVREAVAPQLAELAAAMGADVAGSSPEQAARAAIGRVVEIRDRIGMPKRLRERLPDRGVLPEVARRTMDDFSIRATPRPVDADDVLRVLEEAW